MINPSESNRLFNCTACGKVRFICSRCDRGNIYCTTCAPGRHLQARRRASARYQATTRGKRMHADRQRRYRERLKIQKVTHNGSKQVYRRALLERARKPPLINPPSDTGIDSKNRLCCFCGKSPSRLLRSVTLQSLARAVNRPFRLHPTRPITTQSRYWPWRCWLGSRPGSFPLLCGK